MRYIHNCIITDPKFGADRYNQSTNWITTSRGREQTSLHTITADINAVYAANTYDLNHQYETHYYIIEEYLP